MGISALEFQNVFLFYLIAIVESISLLAIFTQINRLCQRRLRLLELFGRNTIVVVCTNNLFIEIVRLLDHKITGDILLQWGF